MLIMYEYERWKNIKVELNCIEWESKVTYKNTYYIIVTMLLLLIALQFIYILYAIYYIYCFALLK